MVSKSVGLVLAAALFCCACKEKSDAEPLTPRQNCAQYLADHTIKAAYVPGVFYCKDDQTTQDFLSMGYACGAMPGRPDVQFSVSMGEYLHEIIGTSETGSRYSILPFDEAGRHYLMIKLDARSIVKDKTYSDEKIFTYLADEAASKFTLIETQIKRPDGKFTGPGPYESAAGPLEWMSKQQPQFCRRMAYQPGKRAELGIAPAASN